MWCHLSATVGRWFPPFCPWPITQFLPHPWSADCLPEAGITGVATLPAKVADWPDTRAPILFWNWVQGIEPRISLAKSQNFATKPSWQPLWCTTHHCLIRWSRVEPKNEVEKWGVSYIWLKRNHMIGHYYMHCSHVGVIPSVCTWSRGCDPWGEVEGFLQYPHTWPFTFPLGQ